MDVQGYCYIKKGATTGVGDKKLLPSFFGNRVRVLEFADDGGVMVVNNEATAIATFDKQDVEHSFRCYSDQQMVYPENCREDFAARLVYSTRVFSRKGGYHPMLREMIIVQSLAKDKFDDSILWAKM